MSRRPRWRWDPFPFFTISGIAHPGEIITCNTGCTNSTTLVRVVSNFTFAETLNFYLVYKKAFGEYHASLKVRFVVKKTKTLFNHTEAKV